MATADLNTRTRTILVALSDDMARQAELDAGELDLVALAQAVDQALRNRSRRGPPRGNGLEPRELNAANDG